MIWEQASWKWCLRTLEETTTTTYLKNRSPTKALGVKLPMKPLQEKIRPIKPQTQDLGSNTPWKASKFWWPISRVLSHWILWYILYQEMDQVTFSRRKSKDSEPTRASGLQPYARFIISHQFSFSLTTFYSHARIFWCPKCFLGRPAKIHGYVFETEKETIGPYLSEELR